MTRRAFPRGGVRTRLPVTIYRRASDEFSPTEIPGLALWLDAADSSTLFQNSDGTVPATASSDPVGAWLDKSGNNRHAVQATAGNRPTVGASSTAGKNAVRNNGTGAVALQVAAWPYTAGNTQFAVFNASTINQAIYQRGSLNDEPRMALQTGANSVAALRATRGGSVLAQTNSEVGYALSQWSIGATLFNTSLGQAYRDGVYGAATTDSQTFSGDQELRLLSLPSNIYGINGGIAEFLYYDRQLTATEVTRVARYLSSRWGITLAPQVSNADAQDWINRVYANGGTVSTATAAAVNTLCDSLDAASLRDRFYRLNLFCGSNINAALVPLYRGPSLGSPLGNATDTNVNFASGDYTESDGLLGSPSPAKYLRTGLSPDNVGVSTGHLSMVAKSAASSGAGMAIGSRNTGASQRYEIATSSRNAFQGDSVTDFMAACFWGGTSQITYQQTGDPARPSGLYLLTRTSSTRADFYVNGTSVANSTSSVTPGANSNEFYVHARNQDGTPGFTGATTMRGYSFGLAVDATQSAAYSAAIASFNAALGRT